MQAAALRAFPALGKLSSNAYELLPTTPRDSPLLPEQSGRPPRKRRPAPVSASRRFWVLVIVLPATLLVAACVTFATSGGSALLASAGPPPTGTTTDGTEGLEAEAPAPTEVALPEQQETEEAAVIDGHPRFHLSPTSLRPPAQPVPYPAPPPSCLLHLWTSSPADFDPAQCDLSSSLERVDSAILFVNGTGDLFVSAYEGALHAVNAAGGGVRPARRHYTNMGELRFALRSIARNLVGGRLGAGWVHGVGSDFPSLKDDDDRTTRFGQIPHWLDWNLVDRPWVAAEPAEPAEAIANEEPDPFRREPDDATDSPVEAKTLSWCFHSEIFQGEESWKAEALPTFNSFAIESQLANIPELSPSFVSMNDDFMILRPLSASDFHTSLFGPVLKLQDDLKVTGKENAQVGDSGEWGGLEWAAWILGRRHPTEGLEYLNHLPKTLTQPHLHELSLTFKDALRESSLRRFREQKTHGPDVEIAFLATHYIRQRFREALLFSFTIARPATASGSTWGRREKEELRALGVDGWQGSVSDVPEGKRGWSSEVITQTLRDAGEEEPLATSYRFASASGLPRNPFAPGGTATLDLGLCLGSWWTDGDNAVVEATEIFRRLAFENIHAQCGSLLVTAILNRSTERGLTALFPRANTFFQPTRTASPSIYRPSIMDVPHLPLTPTWQEADFSLAALLPAWDDMPAEGVDLQLWTLRLLGRYRYTLGSTPSHFTSVRTTSSLGQLTGFLNGNPDLALLALNDDIPESYSDSRRHEIKNQVRDWGNGRWPGREAWETEDP